VSRGGQGSGYVGPSLDNACVRTEFGKGRSGRERTESGGSFISALGVGRNRQGKLRPAVTLHEWRCESGQVISREAPRKHVF
jgi:hypothetical protein